MIWFQSFLLLLTHINSSFPPVPFPPPSVTPQVTHSGEPKPLFWRDHLRHQQRFKRFLPMIHHHVVSAAAMAGHNPRNDHPTNEHEHSYNSDDGDDGDDGKHSEGSGGGVKPPFGDWEREAAQRNAITDALRHVFGGGDSRINAQNTPALPASPASPALPAFTLDDLVIISDVDEVPCRAVVGGLSRCDGRFRLSPCAVLKTRFHQFNFQWVKRSRVSREWRAPHVVRARTLLPSLANAETGDPAQSTTR